MCISMWITILKFFLTWKSIDILFIFRHFYRILLDIVLLFLYNQYAIFLREGVICYAVLFKKLFAFI